MKAVFVLLLTAALAAPDAASRRKEYVKVMEMLLPGEAVKTLGSDFEDATYTLTSLQSVTAILLQCMEFVHIRNSRMTCTNTCEVTYPAAHSSWRAGTTRSLA